MFNHFLLTRFNIKGLFNKKDKNNIDVLTDNWLSHRFNLFETICLPSISNQINKNFKWLVYFDTNTDSFFLDKIEKIRLKHPFFLPYFVEDSDQMFSSYKQDINNLMDNENQYLITTRIDNDDCLSKFTIEKIQSLFDCQSFQFINLYYGYAYSETKKVLIKKGHYNNPCGTSLIEKSNENGFSTVWCGPHGSLGTMGDMLDLYDQRYWLQIFHERNLINRLNRTQKRYMPVFKFENSLFGIYRLEISFFSSMIYMVRYFIFIFQRRIKYHIRRLFND